MDTNVLITAMWIGLVIGGVVSAVLTLMTLPASYLMNTFAYHHWSFRLGMMLAMFLPFIISATTLWLSSPLLIPWSLIALVPNLLLLFTVGAWKRAHYYGLFPLYEAAGKPIEATGFAASLFKFFLLLIHPIVMVTDTEAITKSLGSLIVKDDALPPVQEVDGKPYRPGIVNEDFTKATTAAGKLEGESWDKMMESLTGAANAIYGASPLPPAPADNSGLRQIEETSNKEAAAKAAASRKIWEEKFEQEQILYNKLRETAPYPKPEDIGTYWEFENTYIGKLESYSPSHGDRFQGTPEEYKFSSGKSLSHTEYISIYNGQETFKQVNEDAVKEAEFASKKQAREEEDSAIERKKEQALALPKPAVGDGKFWYFKGSYYGQCIEAKNSNLIDARYTFEKNKVIQIRYDTWDDYFTLVAGKEKRSWFS